MIQHSAEADERVRNGSEMKIIEKGLLSRHLGGNTWGGRDQRVGRHDTWGRLVVVVLTGAGSHQRW